MPGLGRGSLRHPCPPNTLGDRTVLNHRPAGKIPGKIRPSPLDRRAPKLLRPGLPRNDRRRFSSGFGRRPRSWIARLDRGAACRHAKNRKRPLGRPRRFQRKHRQPRKACRHEKGLFLEYRHGPFRKLRPSVRTDRDGPGNAGKKAVRKNSDRPFGIRGRPLVPPVGLREPVEQISGPPQFLFPAMEPQRAFALLPFSAGNLG